MIQFLELNNFVPAELTCLMKHAETDIQQLFPLTQYVINQVHVEGDGAVVRFTQQFGAKNFKARMFKATKKDFEEARVTVNAEVIDAISQAPHNIARFYLSQKGYIKLEAITNLLADYEDLPANAMAIDKRNEIISL